MGIFCHTDHPHLSGWIKGLVACGLAVLIGKVSLILIFANHGFDLTDEGSTMLYWTRPDLYPVNVHNFHFLLKFVPERFVSVKFLRIAWTVAETVAVAALILGVLSLFRLTLCNSKLTILFVAISLNGLFTGVYDRILNYNVLSTLFSFSAMGLVLASTGREGRTTSPPCLFLAGVLLAFQLFVKPSTAVLLGLLFVLLVDKRSRPARWLPIGFVVGLLIFVALFLPPITQWAAGRAEGFKAASVVGYGSSLMHQMYGLYAVFLLACGLIANLPVVFLIRAWISRATINEKQIELVLIFGHIASTTLLLSMFQITSTREFMLETMEVTNSSRYFPVLIFPNTVFYVYLIRRVAPFGNGLALGKQEKRAMASLLLLPIVIFYGSFGSVVLSLFSHITPVLAVSFLMPIFFLKAGLAFRFNVFQAALALVLCSGSFLHNQWFNPAMLLAPIPEQTVEVGQKEMVLVDAQTAKFVQGLKRSLPEVAQNQSMIYLGLQPGVVYLLGGHQPGSAMYLSLPQLPEHDIMRRRFSEFFINRYQDEFNRSVIFLGGDARFNDSSWLLKDLAAHTLVDSVYNPYLARLKCSGLGFEQMSPFTLVYMPGNYSEHHSGLQREAISCNEPQDLQHIL